MSRSLGGRVSAWECVCGGGVCVCVCGGGGE